jgi:hypothetical protein
MVLIMVFDSNFFFLQESMHGASCTFKCWFQSLIFQGLLLLAKKNSMKSIDDTRITKLQNGISRNDWNECPFYHTLDNWWHQNENVMKHVTDFVDESDQIMGSPKF